MSFQSQKNIDHVRIREACCAEKYITQAKI